MIDRIGFWRSGFCYGMCKEPISDPSPETGPRPGAITIMMHYFLSPGKFLIITFFSIFKYYYIIKYVQILSSYY